MFRAYRQVEHSDCGLTCIRMVARHFGTRVPLRYLHSVTDINRLGATVGDVASCCRKLGMSAGSNFLLTDARQSCYADKVNHALINYDGHVFACTARDFIPKINSYHEKNQIR